MLGNLAKGIAVEESIEDATRACYPALVEKSVIARKSLAKMRQPDICKALEGAYEAKGFSIEDSIDEHIKHIRGEHVKDVLYKGEVIQLRVQASFAALQAYQKFVIPAQTAKVQIEHTNLNDMMRTLEGEAETVHRTVGSVIDVEPEPGDDEDPFEDDEGEEDDDE